MSYYNPHWAKTIQNQQKAQLKPSGKPQQQQQPKQQEKPRDYGGFDSLVVGRECVIKLGNGEAIKGTVSAASKYFYLVTVGGQVVIVNKAYVATITPIQTPQNNNTNDNGAGDRNDGNVSKQK